MRNLREFSQLEHAAKTSYQSEKQFVISNKMKREFFRYQDGELVEYDLTRANGLDIQLKKEERNAITENNL